MTGLMTSHDRHAAHDVDRVLRIIDSRPTVAAYRQGADKLRALREQLRPIRVSMLATFTSEMLTPYFEVEAARLGFGAEIYHGPFNSVRQELLNHESGCFSHAPDIVFIAQLLEDVCPRLVDDFLALSEDHVQELIAETIKDLSTCLEVFRSRSGAAVVVSNFVLPSNPPLGIFEAAAPQSQTKAIQSLNRSLVESLADIPSVYVLDLDRLSAGVGYRASRHDEMWYSSRAPLSQLILPRLGQLQATFINALFGVPRKCLVLDLDNTLWGGIVGEDGLAGIQLGHASPGNIYRDVQRAVLQLYRRGVLLAICSKNNLEDVDEVLTMHPEMILKREHFASIKVNWRSKPENLQEIADELQIGVDSLVFLDDSPVECDLMRQRLPQVLTWEGFNADGKPDPIKSLETLLNSHVFDKLSYTEDDRRRGEMYQQQVARRQSEQSATSVEDYLRGLGMSVEIHAVDDFTFPRVVDLIHKTNQFNLTTRRHSETHLRELVANPEFHIFTINVTDRFGDNGIVGVSILREREDVASIDTFLLSCRVIGRAIESAFLRYLVDWSIARNASFLEGEFLPTAKNKPAANFFAEHGFTQVDGSHWLLALDNVPFRWPDFIETSQKELITSPIATNDFNDESRLFTVIASVLGVDITTLSDDSSPHSIATWDSLNHLDLVMALESEYGISLTSEDAVAMQTVGSIRAILNQSNTSAALSSMQFVDCLPEHIAAIKVFIAKSYGQHYVLGANDAYFEWQFGSDREEQSYHLRLAIVDGQIAGCLGYIPVQFDHQGARYLGCWLANWMVDPDYRHLGIGPFLVREVSRDFEVTLALGANEEARDVLKRMGWTDFGMLTRYVSVLDLNAAAGLTDSGKLEWPTADDYATANFRPTSSALRIDRFTNEAEQLWDTYCGCKPTVAGTRKTVAYLNWRYVEHPQFDYRLFETRRDGKLVGFAVYRVEQARGLALRVGRIVEFVVDGEADALLSAVLADARSQSVVAVDFFCGTQQFAPLLQRHGFLPGDDLRAQQIPTLYQPIDRRRTGIRFLADLRGISKSQDPVNWYVTKADGDQDRPN